MLTSARFRAVFVAAVLAPVAARAAIVTNPWTPLFVGIDYTTASASGPGIDLQQGYAVRIDLGAPGIGFVTTPHSGSLNTVSETTTQFLERSGAQLAINANFFAPCCDPFPEEKTVIGLAISQGSLVAPAVSDRSGAGTAVLLLSQQNQARITSTTTPQDLTNVYNAVAGSAIILQNGINIGAQHDTRYADPTNPNPRTDVGLSRDGRFLYLLTIDGRQPGYSIGATVTEAADMLLALGAYNGLNLDGGGSTTLVRSDGRGGALELNRPSGGTERYDANAFGVFAEPIPEPATVMLACLALALIAARLGRRHLASRKALPIRTLPL